MRRILRVLEPEMTPEERGALQQSAQRLTQALQPAA
jgi:hypothetical protein